MLRCLYLFSKYTLEWLQWNQYVRNLSRKAKYGHSINTPTNAHIYYLNF